MRTCESCGCELHRPKRGPAPRTCGQRCRKRLSRTRQISGPYPEAMRRKSRWTAAAGKRPVRTDGAPASSTNPRTWTRFTDVRHRPHGFMCGAGIGCIDLDHCLDDHGRPNTHAARILALNPDAYVEISVSGTGLHIFGLRDRAPGIRRPGLEVYSQGRFIRTTGRTYRPGTRGGLHPLNY